MGNVRRHGRGWQLRYQVGGQRMEETAHVETKTEALHILKEREARAILGTLPPKAARQVRFEDLARDLKEDYQLKGRRSLKNLETYLSPPKSLANDSHNRGRGAPRKRQTNLASYFRGRRAISITTDEIKAYARKRQEEGATNATINRELAALKRMFRLAVEINHLDRVPHFPMLRESNPRQGFMDQECFRAVVQRLPDYLKPVAEFAYFTGWRLGEITSLSWDQLDLANSEVRLWAGTTKNQEGRARPLGPETSKIVETQKEARRHDCPWVFHRNGERIATVHRAWKKACEEAGHPGLIFHDMRRSAARHFDMAGLTEAEGMALGGWKTNSVYRRYSIIDPARLSQAVWRAEAFAVASAPQAGKDANTPKEAETVGSGSRVGQRGSKT